MRSPFVLLLVAGSLAAGASAQQTKVLPASAAGADGSASTPYFSGYGGGRAQQIFLSGAVARGAGLIREVRLRADLSSINEPKRSFSAFKLSIGTTSVSPAQATSTFASNRSNPLTQVFSGNYDLPAQTGKQLFNIVWKFNTPYLYTPALGHLILEWEVPVTPTKSNYFLDAHADLGTSGSSTSFGQGGTFSTAENYVVQSDDAQLQPGGSMLYRASGFSQTYPALVAFGFSNTSYGPLLLPFDMTPVGAPGNSLYVSLDLVLPCTWKMVSGRNVAESAFPIPNVKGLEGFVMYAQGIFVDLSANAFGVVTSPGLRMELPHGVPVGTLIGHYDYQSATGNGRAGTGLVVELEGVLP